MEDRKPNRSIQISRSIPLDYDPSCSSKEPEESTTKSESLGSSDDIIVDDQNDAASDRDEDEVKTLPEIRSPSRKRRIQHDAPEVEEPLDGSILVMESLGVMDPIMDYIHDINYNNPIQKDFPLEEESLHSPDPSDPSGSQEEDSAENDLSSEETSTPVVSFGFNKDKHLDPAFLENVSVSYPKLLGGDDSEESNCFGIIETLPNCTLPIHHGRKAPTNDPSFMEVPRDNLQAGNEEGCYKLIMDESFKFKGPSSAAESPEFRKICLYINGKVEMPSRKVLTVEFSPTGSLVVIGGEGGLLKLLEVKDHGPNFGIRGTGPDVGVAFDVLRHENLEGHMHNVERISWKLTGERFTTSDDKGVIVSWINWKGIWQPEYIQDRNTSKVLGIFWSPNGSKVCFIYEDTVAEDKSEAEGPKGGIVMGLADGRRLWTKEMDQGPPSAIIWINDNRFTMIKDNWLITYHVNGLQTNRSPIHLEGDEGLERDQLTKVVTFLQRPQQIDHEVGFYQAIVWESGRMTLLRGLNFLERKEVCTMLTTTAAAWSPSGLFIAVGGTSRLSTSSGEAASMPLSSKVNIISCIGEFLTSVKFDQPGVSSVSWDVDSLHLAVGVDNFLLFAKISPTYKFSCGEGPKQIHFASPCSGELLAQVELELRDEMKLDKVIEFVKDDKNRSHPVLWNAIAKAALRHKRFLVADFAFAKAKNYPGLLLVRRLDDISSDEYLQRAEICCFYGDFDKAERYFIKAGNKKLAIKMWSDLDLSQHTRVELEPEERSQGFWDDAFES